MNPRAFLEVADELATGIHEGFWRSAVSRAYYGAFHAARQLLVTCGFEVPRVDRAHAYLSMRLSNSQNASNKAFCPSRSGREDSIEEPRDLGHLFVLCPSPE